MGRDIKGMNKEQAMVREFHRKYGVMEKPRPTVMTAKVAELRNSLISEEMTEIIIAINSCDMKEIADALADSLYVIYGTAVSCGIDLEPIFEEVHRSNMTKSGNLRDDGKILKGDDWSPPDIVSLLQKQSGV